MEGKRFTDGITVTAAKIVAFLRTEVIGRPNRRKADQTVGHSTIRGYGAACQDLYRQQVVKKINANPDPSTNPTLQGLYRTVRARTHKHRRDNYVDRGQGTIQDGYTTTDDLIKISDEFLTWNSAVGIKGRAMFLLAHSCFMRGESVRMMEFADLFCMELTNEGFTKCMALCIVLDQGKTNSFGKKELGACIRHKLVAICPVGALAFHMFHIWHIERRPFLNLTQSSEWFDFKV
jgi:hypothetical protein